MRCRMRVAVYWYWWGGKQRACEFFYCKTRLVADKNHPKESYMNVRAVIGGCNYKGAAHKAHPVTKDIYYLHIEGDFNN